MHPYAFIENKIVESMPSAWQLSAEDLSVNYFGSYLCVFINGQREVRWVWDGKDGWGFVQEYINDSWNDLPIFLTEGDIEGVPQNTSKIAQLLGSIHGIFHSGI